MFSFPIQILPADVAAETAALNEKLAKGISNLTNLTDDDIDIGSTPKDVVFEQDGKMCIRDRSTGPFPRSALSWCR